MADRVPGRTYKVPLLELRHDPKNVNTHSEKSIDAIAASMKQFGQQKPIVISPKGTVLAGNGMLDAATKLGWDRIECRVTELSGKQARAFAIADNRIPSLSSFDTDKLHEQLEDLYKDGFPELSIGWSNAELQNLLTAPDFSLDSKPQWEDVEVPNSDDSTESDDEESDEDGVMLSGGEGGQPSSHATLILTREQYDIVMRAVHALRMQEQTMEITVGRAIELICADFIGG